MEDKNKKRIESAILGICAALVMSLLIAQGLALKALRDRLAFLEESTPGIVTILEGHTEMIKGHTEILRVLIHRMPGGDA